MARFNFDYSNPMDRQYMSGPPKVEPDIEAPISTGVIGVRDLGKSVTEGRGEGTFLNSVQAAMFEGASQVELSMKPESSEPLVSAESYGRDARRDLKEMAKINKLTFTSVHTPPQVVGNMSGLSREGFSPRMRAYNLNEVKKAIEFAADVGAGGVVVHTGEYQRPLHDQAGKGWTDEKGNALFREFTEEPARGTVYLVDERTGQLISEVAKNQVVFVPKIKTADHSYVYTDETGQQHPVQKGQPIDYTGKPLGWDEEDKHVPDYDENTREFKTEKWHWDDFVDYSKRYNERHGLKDGDPGYLPGNKNWNQQHGFRKGDGGYMTPEKAFMDKSLKSQEYQQRGWELYHQQMFHENIKALTQLKEARRFFKQIEDNTPKEEQWKLLKQQYPQVRAHPEFLQSEQKMPTEMIDQTIRDIEHQIEHTRQSSFSYAQQRAELQRRRQHIVPIGDYAKKQTMKSYAEAGIYAMQQSKHKKTAKPVFLAPENLFPEMGYGSHPQEMIELIKGAREKMAEYLTAEKIEDPSGAVYTRKEAEAMGNPEIAGAPKIVDNPYRQKGLSKKDALKKAENHIKMTFDTQHLGMWWRYFQAKPGESPDDTRKRFHKWYMGQVKELEESNVIGHMHVVDGWGLGHTHLEPGEGQGLQTKKGYESPVINAVEYLKKKGYKGTMISEAFGGIGRRNLLKSWSAFNSPVYSTHTGPMRAGSPQRWSDVWQSYIGLNRAPYFTFGQYSPSEDFKFWSETPME